MIIGFIECLDSDKKQMNDNVIKIVGIDKTYVAV